MKRPLLRALAHDGAMPPVLLIDEVDRADDEFEAFLLEILSDWTISVPELGVVRAEVPPVVVLTSNRTRDVHDALKRRCLYHWIAHPDFERELAIVRLRAPEVPELLARDVAAAVEALRGLELYKPPGVAETIDWAAGAGDARRAPASTSASVDATLGTILKYREDQERVRAHGLARVSCARRWPAVPDGELRSTARRSGSPSRSRGCCAAPGSRSRSGATLDVRAGARLRRARDREPACTGPGGRRSCTGPRTSRVYDRAFAVFWDRRRGGRRRRSSCRPRRSIIALDVPDADDAGARRRRRRRDAPVVTRALEPGRDRCATATSRSYTPAEFVEARRLMADLRLAGARAAVAAAASRRRARAARPTCAAPCGARCAPAASRSTPRVPRRRATRTRPARAAPRRQRLDGAVRPRVRALPARGRREPDAGRGVRARHPAHAHHARAARRAIPTPRCAPRPQRVVDWSGGTRLGDGLRAFNDEWGIRGMARGAVVVILSDGWDRGDPDVLAEQMARLAPGRVPDRVGQPAEGEPGLRAAGAGNGRGAAVR